MSFLDNKILKSNVSADKEIIILNIPTLTNGEKVYILTNLVEISKGRNITYGYTYIAKKIDVFFKTKDKTKIDGATAEFLLICTLRNNGYSQEFCYRNLEENSVKKGFDGLYIKDDQIWITESKASSTPTHHNYNHKKTFNNAYKGICDQIKGGNKKTNDPWENAFNHARAAGATRTLLDELTLLSQRYMDRDFEQIDDLNIILGSTIIDENISKIQSDIPSIDNIISSHKSRKELAVAINLSSNKVLINFIQEVTSNEQLWQKYFDSYQKQLTD